MSDETRYAKSGDVHIAYQVLGEGPPDIVHVPGWATHLELAWSFPSYAHLLKRLASFSRLIVLDKRGTGLSDPVTTTPTLEERMDDLSAVMDAAGSQRAVLFGECEGAPQAILFAATHPGRTESLVLYGAMPCVREDSDSPRWIDANRDLEEAVANWGQGKTVDVFAPSTAGSERVRRSMAAYERASASPGMACALLESLREIDVTSAAQSIQVPTLVLHRRDDIVPIESARRLAALIPGARFVELEGSDHSLPIGDTEPVVAEIEEFVTGVRRRPEPTRALLTVLFTDIVSSTEQAAATGDQRWTTLLDHHDRVAATQVERFGGRVVKTTGDGLMATFDGPARGIRCADAITRNVRALGLDVRAGVHTGEVERRGEDISGLGVVIARRICDSAGSGEVLASRTVKDLVIGSGITFTDRGEHALKGVPDSWQLFAVSA